MVLDYEWKRKPTGTWMCALVELHCWVRNSMLVPIAIVTNSKEIVLRVL